MSPTSRSIEMLKRSGWLVAIVEKWNAHCRIRQDLFGFADILAVKGYEVSLIQTTSGDNVSARVTKIKESPLARIWLQSPMRTIVVHGWAKRGPRGLQKWTCREIQMTSAEMGPIEAILPLRRQKPIANLELFKRKEIT